MGNIGSTSEKICRRFIAGSVVALSLGLTLITGCNNNPKLAKAFVSIMPGNTTIGTGLVFPMYAAASPTGVTWSITGGSNCSGSGCGSLSGATSTSVNYVAPTTIPGNSMSVTVTATSTTDSTIQGSETLTVFPEYVQITGPSNASIPALTTAKFSATVVNDPTNSGVTWSISGSCSTTNEGCGSFSGKPTITQATYVSPGAAANESITITATSVVDPAESASFSVNVSKLTVFDFVPSVLPAAIAGQPYTATVQVLGNTPPYTISVADASFMPSWATVSSVNPLTDTFTITGTPPAGAQGTAYPTLTVTDSSSPSLSAGQAFAISTYPAQATGNGLLTGSYAFFGQGWIDGPKIATTINEVSYIGSFTADGNGNIIGGELDVNGPSGLTSYTSLSGTYDVQYGTDTSGNPVPGSQTGLITLIPSGKPPLPITLAVSLNSIQNYIATAGSFVEFDDTAGIGGTQGPNSSTQRVQGSLALQSQSALNSAASPFAGSSYAFGMAGNSATKDFNNSCLGTSKTCGPITLAGSMAFDAAGDAITSGLEDVQVSETTSSAVPLTGTLANSGNTDASGRVTASIAATSTASMVDWPSDFVLYAISPQSFYIMSADSYATNSLVTGSAMQQNLADIASTPFSATQPVILYGNIVSSTAYSANGTNGQVRSELQIFLPSPSSATAGTMTNGLQWIDASGTYTSTATPGTVGNFTYTVDPNSGRVSVTITGEPNLYLVDTNTGYGTQHGAGSVVGLFQFQPQTATTLNPGAYAYSVVNDDSVVGPMETGVLQVPSTGVPSNGSTVTLLTGQDYSVFASNGNAYQSSSGETMLYSGPVTGSLAQTNGLFSKSAILLPGTMQGCGQQAPQGGGWVISSTSFICTPSGGSFGDIHIFQQ
jgi:large repetitive protein